MPVVFEESSKNGIERALKLAAEFGLRPIVEGAGESFKIASTLRDKDVPVIVSLNFGEEPKAKEKEAAAARGEGRSGGRPPGGPGGGGGPGRFRGRRGGRGETQGDAKAETDAPASTETKPQADAKPSAAVEAKPQTDAKTDSAAKAETDAKTDKPKDDAPKSDAKPDAAAGDEKGNIDKKPDAAAKKADDLPDDEDPPAVLAEKHRRWEETVAGPATLAKAGVRLAFETADLKSPADFTKNVALAIEKGLPREAALRALTIEPARILGVDRSMGSIEPGKVADLVAMTAELGDSKAQVRWVFVDGIRFEMKVPEKPASTPGGKSDDAPANAAGTWDATTTMAGGQTISSVMELKQSGAVVTGTVKSQMGEITITSGSVSGKSVSLTASASIEGNAFELTFNGTIDGESMSGTVTSPMGESTFTAARRATPKERLDAHDDSGDDEGGDGR
ncbi:MAG: amidohydrolase family protein [Planctomycetes bacterium]|nr:amidohydrolase family protein [Planctomycetota bacterium]